MPQFDRFDICEAHAVLEWDYNVGGWLRERPTNRRLLRSTGVQLSRMGFTARHDLCYETLSDNGKEIYNTLVARYGLPVDDSPSQEADDTSAYSPIDDIGLSGAQLREKYPGAEGGWGEHPEFVRSDWKYEVENDNDFRGYWEWVAHKVEMALDDLKQEHPGLILPSPPEAPKPAGFVFHLPQRKQQWYQMGLQPLSDYDKGWNECLDELGNLLKGNINGSDRAMFMLIAEAAYKAGAGRDRAVAADTLREIVDSVIEQLAPAGK